jgi:hypothetical protein
MLETLTLNLYFRAVAGVITHFLLPRHRTIDRISQRRQRVLTAWLQASGNYDRLTIMAKLRQSIGSLSVIQRPADDCRLSFDGRRTAAPGVSS